MEPTSYARLLRRLRTINCFFYVVSKKLNIDIIILASCYSGAALGFFNAVGLRSLDVSYILFSRDAFPPNSFALEWATNSWSLIHQLGYLGFSLGFDHAQISLAVSAVTGAALVTGLALLIYAISGNGLIAIAAAPIIGTFRFFKIFYSDYGTQYIGSEHLSLQGSAFVILTLGVASAGFFRFAGVLTMVTACIHLLFGIWSTILVILLATLLLFQKKLGSVLEILKGMSIGAFFIFISYLVQKFFFSTSSVFVADDRAFLIWSRLWGHHRNIQFDIPSIISAYICGTLILIYMMLERSRNRYFNYNTFFVLFFSIVASPLFYIAGHSDLGTISEALIQIVPGRFMIFNVFFVLVFFIGVSFRSSFRKMGKNRFVHLSLLLILFFVLIIYFTDVLHSREVTPLVFVSLALAILIAVFIYIAKSNKWLGPSYRDANFVIATIFLTGTILFSVSTGIGSELIASRENGAECKGIAIDGLVLVATYEQYIISQRRCDLPALIDPSATNSLPYIPWAAREMRRIISIAYGVSFENPPLATRNRGTIEAVAFKQIWEGRTAAEWVRVANEFGVGAVMVPPDWSLALGPPIAKGRSYKLYTVR
jgi:hypothetical protein